MGIEAEAVPFLTFLLLLSGWSTHDLTEISAVAAYNPDENLAERQLSHQTVAPDGGQGCDYFPVGEPKEFPR